MGIQGWPGGWSRASGLIHQPMVEGEHPAAVLAVLSRPGLEDFFACESGASDQNPCSQHQRQNDPEDDEARKSVRDEPYPDALIPLRGKA